MEQLLSVPTSRSWSNAFGSMVLFCLLVVSSSGLRAQPPHDTKGQEFWVCFMQNLGSGQDFERSDLRLYISSDTVTTAYIHYIPLDDTLVVSVTRPRVPIEVNISAIFGNDTELAEVDSDGSNAVSSKVFHVFSDHDITLYGVNIRQMSADAFLALPDDVLTGGYIVTAWPNGYLSGNFEGSGFIEEFDTHSQFAVIATEDGTTVEITPAAPLSGQQGRRPFTVVLNLGEVYFGQAVLGSAFDVTGTEIKANKPVAVFGGNQRTSIPLSVGNFRDHLVEQIPPIVAWGRTGILTPHFDIAPLSRESSEARVLAAFDDTEVTVTTAGGSRTWTVNAAAPLQLPLAASSIEANKPILVVQYEHSVGDIPGSPSDLGDPFMMLIPPPEQYDTAYSFQSIIHPEFLTHYINVIVPEKVIAGLSLDGLPVTGATFLPIPGTSHRYAQIKVNPGSHYIRADDRFGLCVYGFGRATSYGYPGGTLFRELEVDFEDPAISVREKCELLEGTIRDDRITDSGIDSCYSTGADRTVRVEIEAFTPGADSVGWRAELIDPYQDGFVEIKGVDGAGRSTTVRRDIPGFTVASVGTDGSQPLPFDIISFNGKEGCSDIQLYNYGAFPQKIEHLMLVPDTLSGLHLQTPLPITLLPGETGTLSICYEGNLDRPVEVTLAVGRDCIDRSVLLARIVTVIDTLPPSMERRGEGCGQSTLTFSEPDEPYLGIASVEIDTIVNGTWSLNPFPLPARTVSLRLTPQDFREDLLVAGTIRDRAGNTVPFFDTVPGFTVAVFERPDSDRLAVRLERDWTSDSLILNSTRCDSLLIVNYGTHPMTITRIFMERNFNFSIPPAQLPITLAAGEQRRFAVCLEGRRAGDQIDTLRIEDACGRWENVMLRTPVKGVSGTGPDFCGTMLNVQSYGATKRTFITTPKPNPSPAGILTVDIGLQRNEKIVFSVYDLAGTSQLQLVDDEEVEAGIHRLEFDASGLEAGVYIGCMTTGSGEILTTKFIIRD